MTSRAKYIGAQVKNLILRKFNADASIEVGMLGSLGKKSERNIMAAEWVQALRTEVAELLVRNKKVRGHLLHYWAQIADDPGVRCTKWTLEGAPAGLSVPTSDLDGYFPTVEEAETADWDDLTTDFDNFQN